ncbi:hypothetical protein [Sphingobium lignivorans]|uniref:Uncharacterized protein n=1 Tax=Sphingobium lignivorans TaxID=2735886 RepID=A0ABR6NBW6_9SPHN|nr:hypothetical protein [Sphingobium lignivorans]MBB5984780.1 hypothetical protein [Sphingobium lignivorans]
MGNVTDWVVSKIDPDDGLTVVGRTPSNFLLIKPHNFDPIHVAVIGIKDVILREHVQPLFSNSDKPQFVVNVPSKTLWSGGAISVIFAAPAAFGTLGDLSKAARSGDVTGYRNKNWAFFEQAISQHSNVRSVTRIYDEVFEAHRRKGGALKIALVDGYHVSAEDVRSARDRFGTFDLAVKKTSYGSVTSAAEEAAASMGAEVLTFKGLMQRLRH